MDTQVDGNATNTQVNLPAILSANDAHDLVSEGKLVLVDIRTPMEWMKTGLAQGALGLTPRDLSFIDELLQIVEGNKSHPIALICATGNRSSQLQQFLLDQGFDAVSDVSEGMNGNRSHGPGWILRGLPTVPYTG